jgi:hypothetical protein
VEVISVSGRRRQHWSSLIVAVPFGCGPGHRQCYSLAIDGVIRTVTVVDTSLSSTCVEVISVSGRRRQHWSSLIVAVPYGCGSSHRHCYSRAINGVLRIVTVVDTSLSSTCVEVISVSGRRRQHWSSLIVAVPFGCGSSHRQCYSRAIDGVIRTVNVADTSLSSTCVEVISSCGRPDRQH